MEEKFSKVQFVKITNRSGGTASYKLNNGVSRFFATNETKSIPLEELQTLMQSPGGDDLLKNYFAIKDEKALESLDIEPEPEYYYNEATIKTLLLEGTLDQLEDSLNFAPAGVIEMIKDLAVKLEVPDTRKRKLILEKTGFSIDNAINVNKVLAVDTQAEDKEEKTVVKRKAQPITEQKKPERKSKYTVVES